MDFKILFSEVNADALLMSWIEIRKNPKRLLNISLEEDDNYHKLGEVHDILTFVKAFPTHRVKFETAVNSLVIFENVSVNFTI